MWDRKNVLHDFDRAKEIFQGENVSPVLIGFPDDSDYICESIGAVGESWKINRGIKDTFLGQTKKMVEETIDLAFQHPVGSVKLQKNFTTKKQEKLQETQLRIDTTCPPSQEFTIVSPSPVAIPFKHSLSNTSSLKSHSQDESSYAFPTSSSESSLNTPTDVTKRLHFTIAELMQQNQTLHNKLACFKVSSTCSEETNETFIENKKCEVLRCFSVDTEEMTSNLYNKEKMNNSENEIISIEELDNLLDEKDSKIFELQMHIQKQQSTLHEQQKYFDLEKEQMESQMNGRISEIREGALSVLLNTKNQVYELLKEVEEYKIRCMKLESNKTERISPGMHTFDLFEKEMSTNCTANIMHTMQVHLNDDDQSNEMLMDDDFGENMSSPDTKNKLQNNQYQASEAFPNDAQCKKRNGKKIRVSYPKSGKINETNEENRDLCDIRDGSEEKLSSHEKNDMQQDSSDDILKNDDFGEFMTSPNTKTMVQNNHYKIDEDFKNNSKSKQRDEKKNRISVIRPAINKTVEGSRDILEIRNKCSRERRSSDKRNKIQQGLIDDDQSNEMLMDDDIGENMSSPDTKNKLQNNQYQASEAFPNDAQCKKRNGKKIRVSYPKSGKINETNEENRDLCDIRDGSEEKLSSHEKNDMQQDSSDDILKNDDFGEFMTSPNTKTMVQNNHYKIDEDFKNNSKSKQRDEKKNRISVIRPAINKTVEGSRDILEIRNKCSGERRSSDKRNKIQQGLIDDDQFNEMLMDDDIEEYTSLPDTKNKLQNNNDLKNDPQSQQQNGKNIRVLFTKEGGRDLSNIRDGSEENMNSYVARNVKDSGKICSNVCNVRGALKQYDKSISNDTNAVTEDLKKYAHFAKQAKKKSCAPSSKPEINEIEQLSYDLFDKGDCKDLEIKKATSNIYENRSTLKQDKSISMDDITVAKLLEECNKFKEENYFCQLKIAKLEDENTECLERLACIGTELSAKGKYKWRKKSQRKKLLAVAKAAGDLESIRKIEEANETDSLTNHTGHSGSESNRPVLKKITIPKPYPGVSKVAETSQKCTEVDSLLTDDREFLNLKEVTYSPAGKRKKKTKIFRRGKRAGKKKSH